LGPVLVPGNFRGRGDGRGKKGDATSKKFNGVSKEKDHGKTASGSGSAACVGEGGNAHGCRSKLRWGRWAKSPKAAFFGGEVENSSRVLIR